MKTTKLSLPLLAAGLLLALMLAVACSSASTPTPAPTEAASSPTPLTVQQTAPPPTEAPSAAPTTVQQTAQASDTPSAPALVLPAEAGKVNDGSLYALSCAACHGQDLAGVKFVKDNQTIEAPALAWADLSKAFQTKPERGTVEQQLAIAISKGQDENGEDLNAMMPRWSSLSQAQLDSLVQFIKTAPGAAPTLTSDAANLTGEALYQLSCAACHGQDLAGVKFEKDNQTIEAPALAWADLSKAFQTKPERGTVEQQLAIAISKGQDENGEDLNAMMPRWSSLSQAQLDSLVQFIKTASK